ncbi:MAG: homing endonuclease associated repeat-containing protein [Solirubrobacteraceae bacterium]
MSLMPEPEPEPRRPRPWRAISAARKDNVVLARLMTAPHGRTVTELVERLMDDCPWATRDNVYASAQRLVARGLAVRQLTPRGYLYQAVAPDPEDPLEIAYAAPAARDVDVRALSANDRQHKTRRDRYTHDEIIAAILRWADAHDGEPPRQADWNPALLRTHARRLAVKAVAHLRRIAEYDAGDWPSEQTVRKYFGSWNAALAAAGFRDHLRSSGNQLRERDLTLVPGTGAVDDLERLLDSICAAHHGNDREGLRATLLDLSLVARDWAMRVNRPGDQAATREGVD